MFIADDHATGTQENFTQLRSSLGERRHESREGFKARSRDDHQQRV